MIYLLYIIPITHIISYNKMLITYHMSSRENHLSNIHLNMKRNSTYIPLTFCSNKLYSTAIIQLVVYSRVSEGKVDSGHLK